MSLDQYQFHMIVRQERMTREERLEADEQIGRIAQGLFGLAQTVAHAVRRRDEARRGGAVTAATAESGTVMG